jgi:hypothetical protein
MERSTLSRLGVVVALVVALGAAPAALAGPASELSPDLGPVAAGSPPATILDHLTDDGSPVHLGLGVAPLRTQLPATIPGAVGGEGERALDAEARGTALSFDLKLAWPGAATVGPLEPYLALGPALFVIEPDYAGRLLGTRVDPTLQLGAKAGAGVNWRLGKRATLFGAYEVTTTGPGGLSSRDTKPSGSGISGYDFTYGLRFLY